MIKFGPLRINPVEYGVSANAILGIKNSGKSFTATYFAEQLFDAGIPFVAFDPAGIWRFMRVPGKGHGYQVVIAGGEAADWPLTPATAAEIMRAAMRDGISLILDLHDPKLSKNNWRQIVMACTNVLLFENTKFGLRHVFFEEAAEFCLPMDTEVLTPTGWMKPEQITNGQAVVAFDLTSETYHFEAVQRIIRRHHRGEMIPLRTARLDALVTPDHRTVLRRWQHDPHRYRLYDWTFCAAADAPGAYMVPNGGAPVGTGVPALDETTCRVLGWIITDGWRHSRGTDYLCLEQSTSTTKRGLNICAEMQRILGALGVVARQRKRGPHVIDGRALAASASLVWFLGSTLSSQLMAILDEDIHRIPRRLLLDGSRCQLDALWQGLMEGDGTSDGKRWRYFFAGKNEKLADDVQELAVRLGVRTIKRFVPQNGQWRLSIADQKHHFVRRREAIQFDGEVWDITVPSGAFVARRNGTVFVTGNCPQSVGRDLGQCYAEVEKLVRIGGNSRVGSTLISPRSQEINKAVLELCENMFLHRQRGKNALQNLDKWLDIAGKSEREQIIASLPDLPTGQCWAWLGGGDKITPPTLVKVPAKNSFHPDRRVLRGEVTVGRKKAVDVGRFIETMRGSLVQIEEEAKAPAKLRSELATLRKQLEAAQAKPTAAKPDREAIEAARKEGYERAEASRNRAAAKAAREQLVALLEPVLAAFKAGLVAVAEAQGAAELAVRAAKAFQPVIAAEPWTPSPAPAPSPPRALSPERKQPTVAGDGTLSKTDLRMLAAIAYWNALGIEAPTRVQVAFLCHWKPTSGHPGNVAGSLRTRGLITYPTDGTLALTAEGRAAAPAPDMSATVADSVRAVLDGSQLRAFDYLLSQPGHEAARDDLAVGCGWSPTSGHPGNVVGSMRSLEIVTYPSDGRVLLADWIVNPDAVDRRAA